MYEWGNEKGVLLLASKEEGREGRNKQERKGRSGAVGKKERMSTKQRLGSKGLEGTK
jgi:hypothetical protein